MKRNRVSNIRFGGDPTSTAFAQSASQTSFDYFENLNGNKSVTVEKSARVDYIDR